MDRGWLMSRGDGMLEPVKKKKGCNRTLADGAQGSQGSILKFGLNRAGRLQVLLARHTMLSLTLQVMSKCYRSHR